MSRRYPAVVRGLFLDTPAGQKWAVPGYLSSKIGDFSIPVVRNAEYGTLQNDRAVLTFREVTNNNKIKAKNIYHRLIVRHMKKYLLTLNQKCTCFSLSRSNIYADLTLSSD